MKKLLFTCVLLLATLIQLKAQNYMIAAKLTGFKNNLKVRMLDDNDNELDRTELKQGSFTLTGKLKDGPQYVDILITDGDEDYRCTLFANGHTTITGSKAAFPYNLAINGTKEQTRYNAYQRQVKKYNLQREALMKELNRANKRGDTAASNNIVRRYNGISSITDVITVKNIFSNTDAYYAAYEIPNFQHNMSVDSVRQFYEALSPAIKQSIYGKRLKLTLQPSVKINDPIFDFTALNQYGKSQRLSDLKGKYILLDFSSIYCGPCNDSIDELRLISQKYKNQVQVVTFSLDPKKDWLKGVKQENITWLSLCDGKGNYSETALRYGVDGMPHFVIISPDGTVVDKWESYGKRQSGIGELEEKIIAQIKK